MCRRRKKVENHSLKFLFESLGKELPSETVARNNVTQLAEREENRIHNKTLQDNQILGVIDGTEINEQKFTNCLVVNRVVSAVTILSECFSLQNSVNNTTITEIVLNVLRKLGTQREKFLLLLSDATCLHVPCWKVSRTVSMFDACHLH